MTDPNAQELSVETPGDMVSSETPGLSHAATSEVATQVDAKPARKPCGFAAMRATPEGRARIIEWARKGGKAAHAAGTAHEWDRDAARAAGAKGGKASHAARARKQGQS